VAVKERRRMNGGDRKQQDRVLDEVINARKDVYILNNDHVIKEQKNPDLSEYSIEDIPGHEKYVSREVIDRNTERYREHLEEEFSKAVAHEQHRKARKLTGRRIFETVVVLLLVVFVSALLILMMYPQTQLAEMSRDNSNAKDRITKLKNEILDAEEEANGVSDMDRIREQALAFGMQDPNQNQVINLPVPQNDSLKTIVSYDAYGISEEALDSAVASLTDYYRTHPAGNGN